MSNQTPNYEKAFEVFKRRFVLLARTVLYKNYLNYDDELDIYSEEIINEAFMQYMKRYYPLAMAEVGDDPECIFQKNAPLIKTIMQSLAGDINIKNKKNLDNRKKAAEFYQAKPSKPTLRKEYTDLQHCIEKQCGAEMLKAFELIKDGFSQKEVAEKLNIEYDNFRLRLFRCRPRLKKCL